MLTAIGMAAFAERARRELIATGETVRKRNVETVTTLTAQEALIALLARDGRMSADIDRQLPRRRGLWSRGEGPEISRTRAVRLWLVRPGADGLA